jgi:hypothetical protein
VQCEEQPVRACFFRGLISAYVSELFHLSLCLPLLAAGYCVRQRAAENKNLAEASPGAGYVCVSGRRKTRISQNLRPAQYRKGCVSSQRQGMDGPIRSDLWICPIDKKDLSDIIKNYKKIQWCTGI